MNTVAEQIMNIRKEVHSKTHHRTATAEDLSVVEEDSVDVEASAEDSIEMAHRTTEMAMNGVDQELMVTTIPVVVQDHVNPE